jgi:hypothetical protein
LAAELKQALIAKQESELLLWLDDITSALTVGRVVRALKLSSLPPKAGVRLPPELAVKLAEGAMTSLAADAMPDRWVAVLEAAAFAPMRSLIKPAAPPATVSDELTATVKRLAPALPQIATLFGIEVTGGSSMPKPLRPARPGPPARKPAPARAAAAPTEAAAPEAAAPEVAVAEVETAAVEAVVEVEVAEVEAVAEVETAAVEAVAEVEVAEVETASEAEPEAPAEPA